MSDLPQAHLGMKKESMGVLLFFRGVVTLSVSTLVLLSCE
jgi:hypothetical protein